MMRAQTAPALPSIQPQVLRLIALSAVLVLAASAVSGQPSFFRDKELKVMAELHYGETTPTLDFNDKPPYLGVHFEGQVGDKVDIKVTSIDGQAMAALTDSEYRPIISNFGSHITAVLPPSGATYPNRYFIILREERGNPATFTVSLKRQGEDAAAASKDYLACTTDSECVAVDREGCCHNGYKDAVHKDRIDSYRAANACKLANPICPQFRILERRVAQCNLDSHRCEMVQPDQIQCGGKGNAAHACPAGYTCRNNGVPDMPGVCAPQ